MPESPGIIDHYDHYAPHDDYYDDYAGYGDYGWNGGKMHADDFHAKSHEKVDGKNLQAQKNSKPEVAGGEQLTPEEEQELKGMPEGQDKMENDSFDKLAGPDRLEKPEFPERPQRP